MNATIDYDASTRNGRDALRTTIHEAWDGGDPWGSAMSNGFGLCDVLYWTGGNVPTEIDYRPGIGGPDEESYPDSVFLELSDNGTITQGDLAYWARVINRFFDLVPESDRY
jgi:hypothetical protein